MPPRRKLEWVPRYGRKRPVDYLQPKEEWPTGALEPDAPREARLARGIAAKLDRLILDSEAKKAQPDAETVHPKAKTVDQAAKGTDMARQTIYNVRDGETWPDFITIVRLEIYFNCKIWGNEHRTKPPAPPV